MVDKSILESNDEVTARLEALAARLTDDDLKRDLGGGWHVSVAFAHLAFWDRRVEYMHRRWANEGIPHVELDDDVINHAIEFQLIALEPRRPSDCASRPRRPPTPPSQTARTPSPASSSPTTTPTCSRAPATAASTSSRSRRRWRSALPWSRIRDFEAGDYPAVRAIDEAEQETYRGPLWDAGTPQQRERFLMTIPEHVAVYAASPYCLIAEGENAIVGFLFALPLLPDVLTVDAVAVVPEMRRQGVGRRLYAELLTRARQQGVRRIQALISLDNLGSMALHESAGFTLRDRKEAVLEL